MLTPLARVFSGATLQGEIHLHRGDHGSTVCQGRGQGRARPAQREDLTSAGETARPGGIEKIPVFWVDSYLLVAMNV